MRSFSAFDRTTLLLGIAAFCTLGGANLVAGVDAQSLQPVAQTSVAPAHAAKDPAMGLHGLILATPTTNAPVSRDPAIGLRGIASSAPAVSSASVQPAAPSAAPADFYNLF